MDTVMQNMNVEVEAAVNFFSCLLVKAQFSVECSKTFSTVLSVLLKQHYKGHWYPNEPMKGSGYRCLRVNGVMHPILVEAAENCKFPIKKVRSAFPSELTVWVDPNNVSVRFGEEGSIGLLYFKDNTCDVSNSPNPRESEQIRKSTDQQRQQQKISCIPSAKSPAMGGRKFWAKWPANETFENRDNHVIDDDDGGESSNFSDVVKNQLNNNFN